MKKFFRFCVVVWFINWVLVIITFFCLAIFLGLYSKVPVLLNMWLDLCLCSTIVLGVLFVIVYFRDCWDTLKDFINDDNI